MLWIDRKFDFALPFEMYPNVIERLHGTPARLEEKLAGLTNEVLTRKPDGKWSIQEQVGHLSDVEELWLGRIDDYHNGLKELRPADITNRVTSYKNHNADAIANLLRSFRSSRKKLVEQFKQFDIQRAGLSALHPRLNKPMRVIDLAYFVAEHDDHHLVKIGEIMKAGT
jgi:uncharacterized damage-inducible protein DinB